MTQCLGTGAPGEQQQADDASNASPAGAGGSRSAGAESGAPIPASLLGPGMALSAALGEVGVGEGEEADMGRLQVLMII